MENNTKIAIGLAAAVVVGYIVYKSSKPKTQTQSGSKPEPNCICKQYPCDCGDSSSSVTSEEIERLEADRKTLGSIATLFEEQPYQDVYNDVPESINIADLNCDKVGDVRKNCTNVKNQLIYTYTPPMSWNNSIIMPAQYTLETDNMFYEYDVNGNFVRWSPKLDRDRYSILK
jgi:hypothetical protein